ncbi:hypothetical protein RRG08_063824, partial [Elysia crispata]
MTQGTEKSYETKQLTYLGKTEKMDEFLDDPGDGER